MAKVQITDAMAMLADFGIELTSKQKEAIAEAQAKAMRQPALNVFMGDDDKLPGKCIVKTEEVAEAWVARSFELAEAMVSDIVSDEKKVQGGAVRTVRLFGIDTPNGHLKVELRTE